MGFYRENELYDRISVRSHVNVFIVSLCFYLPSTAMLPAFFYYLFPFLLFFIGAIERKDKKIATGTIFLLSLSFIFSLASLFLFFGDINFRDNFLPIQISLLFSFFCALYLNEKVAKFLILFVLFEIICGYIQYLLGVKSFFSTSQGSGYESELLYYNRVFGLSNNSSSFAGNALIALVLFELYFANKIKLSLKLLFYTMVLFALVVSFSRSGLVAFFAYFLLFALKALKNKNVLIGIMFFSLIALALMLFYDLSGVFDQFTRGKGQVEISGRDIIWSKYIQVAMDNFFLGNFGFRDYLSFDLYGEMHAHNSYLMIFYIVGGVSWLLLFLPLSILLLLRNKKLFVLMPLLIYSAAQYFLFWGASLADITFFAVLLSRVSEPDDLINVNSTKS